MKKIAYSSITAFLLVTPALTFAAGKTLRDLVAIFIQYISVGIYLIVSLAVVTFVWNVYRYFFTEKDKKEAGMYVFYSTIGFFIMLSFWGLVAIITNSLKLPTDRPNFPFSSSGTSNSSVFTQSPTTQNNGDFGGETQSPTTVNTGH